MHITAQKLGEKIEIYNVMICRESYITNFSIKIKSINVQNFLNKLYFIGQPPESFFLTNHGTVYK